MNTDKTIKKLTFSQILTHLLSFFQKYKVITIIILALLFIFIAVTFVHSLLISNQVKSQIENKIFIYQDPIVDGYEIFSFKNGYVTTERWYTYDKTIVGDITAAGHKYRIVSSIFNDEIEIHKKVRNGWVKIRTVYLDDSNTVHRYSYTGKDGGDWNETTLEEITTLRITALCEHEYGQDVIIEVATCTSNGKTSRTCGKCGYTETQSTASLAHNYSNKICTTCGAKKQPKKDYNIEPNTWYTYSDVISFQNIKLIDAFPVSNGKGMMVSYYFVCQDCHTVDDIMRTSIPENNYDIKKVYSCDECGMSTTVKITID